MKANKINYCSTFWSDDTFHYPFATHPAERGKKGSHDLKVSAQWRTSYSNFDGKKGTLQKLIDKVWTNREDAGVATVFVVLLFKIRKSEKIDRKIQHLNTDFISQNYQKKWISSKINIISFSLQ